MGGHNQYLSAPILQIPSVKRCLTEWAHTAHKPTLCLMPYCIILCLSINASGHSPAAQMWVLQPHWGINKRREDRDCCLLRNKMMRFALLSPPVLLPCLSLWPLFLPPSASFLRCGQSKHHVERSQSQDLSEEEGGSALARHRWPGVGRAGGEVRPLPPRSALSFQRQRGNSHLSEHALADPSAPTWHKYLHDTGWQGRSYHKSFKPIIGHYKQHSRWPPRQTASK